MSEPCPTITILYHTSATPWSHPNSSYSLTQTPHNIPPTLLIWPHPLLIWCHPHSSYQCNLISLIRARFAFDKGILNQMKTFFKNEGWCSITPHCILTPDCRVNMAKSLSPSLNEASHVSSPRSPFLGPIRHIPHPLPRELAVSPGMSARGGRITGEMAASVDG